MQLRSAVISHRSLRAGLPVPTAATNSSDSVSSFDSRVEMNGAASHNGLSTAVATAEVTEQQQVLRQLQTSMQELQTRFVSDQRHLGSAGSALQV